VGRAVLEGAVEGAQAVRGLVGGVLGRPAVAEVALLGVQEAHARVAVAVDRAHLVDDFAAFGVDSVDDFAAFGVDSHLWLRSFVFFTRGENSGNETDVAD